MATGPCDAGRIAVQFVHPDAECPDRLQHQCGEQGGTVGVEEAVQGATRAVVQAGGGIGGESEQLRLAAADPVALGVDGLVVQDEVADEHGQRLFRRDLLARGRLAEPGLQQVDEVEAVEDGMDQRQCADPAGDQAEGCVLGDGGDPLLTTTHPGVAYSWMRAGQGVHGKLADELDACRQAYDNLKHQLADIGFICVGTVLEVYEPCGKKGCRCHADPPRLHGPYYRWTRKVAGKTVSVRLSPQKAPVYLKCVANRRALQSILDQMTDVSMQAIRLLTGEPS